MWSNFCLRALFFLFNLLNPCYLIHDWTITSPLLYLDLATEHQQTSPDVTAVGDTTTCQSDRQYHCIIRDLKNVCCHVPNVKTAISVKRADMDSETWTAMADARSRGGLSTVAWRRNQSATLLHSDNKPTKTRLSNNMRVSASVKQPPRLEIHEYRCNTS